MNKKIVFITHRINRGGAQRMLTFVANSCVNIFDEVIIILFYTEEVEFVVDSKIKIISLPGELKFPNYKRSLFTKIRDTLYLIKLLRNELRCIKPDLVCAFGVIHVCISVLSALGLGVKIVGSERRSPKNLSLILQQISKIFYFKCDGMVFQLEGAKNFYNKKIIDKATVIPNPYLSEKEYVPYNIEKRDKIITAAAARFEYEKGFDILIKAFKLVKDRHGDFKLIIYGKGDHKKEYGSLIDSLELNNFIEFPGLVKDVSEAVRSSSVFVLPSRSEGIPNTLLEVMGIGVPTVSCDCPPGGPRFLTDRGRRGLLVPVNDFKALARAICEIIENKTLATQISIDSLEIRTELKRDIISKKWVNYFIKVINE